jgi:hypothetical protein
LGRSKILRKTYSGGIEYIIEITYAFSWISSEIIQLIVKGLVILVFSKYFGKTFLKEIPNRDCCRENTSIPFLGFSNKSVREESHPDIFMLVIRFSSAEEGI